MSKYPESLYSGITSDPDTWGMCCSEYQARRCAEAWYDNQIKKDRMFGIIGFLVCTVVAIALIVVVAVVIM